LKRPGYSIAFAVQAALVAQALTWTDTPCQGDEFHVWHEFKRMANARASKGAGVLEAPECVTFQSVRRTVVCGVHPA
jgi:hypothetical protein